MSEVADLAVGLARDYSARIFADLRNNPAFAAHGTGARFGSIIRGAVLL
jgi:hypothetical protein